MNDATIIEFAGRDTVSDPLTDLLRKGARELLQTAVEAELDAFLWPNLRNTAPRRAGPRLFGTDTTPNAPCRPGSARSRCRSRRCARRRARLWRSARRWSRLTSARRSRSRRRCPWLYLKGISTGEMGAALKALLGPDATGFSAKTVARLKAQWAEEYDAWRKADLGRDEWVYVWADGIYSGLRGTDDRLCALVVIGVNARGEKHFLAIEDGVRKAPKAGARSCWGSKAAASTLRNWRSATGPWDFGRLLRKSIPPPGNSAAGCIRRATF